MSLRAIAAAILLLLAGSVSFAAEPASKPAPLIEAKKPSSSCGELPRGGRAYSNCLAAQSRRDATGGTPPTVKPALSSR